MSKFTAEDVDVLVGRYNEVIDEDYDARSKVVKELAAEFKTTVNSVRAKLVSEKVYKAKETKSTNIKAAVNSKEDYRKAFEAATGLTLVSMEKMTKKELKALWAFFVSVSDTQEAEKVA